MIVQAEVFHSTERQRLIDTNMSVQSNMSSLDMKEFLNESQYDSNFHDEVCETGDVVRFGSVAVPVFFSLVILLSLVGNVLVIIILALYENLKSFTNIFILNLAVSDLVFTTGLPFWAIYHIWGWLFSEILCKLFSFIFFTGFYSSILFLTIMTVFRYLAVVYPLSNLNTQRPGIGILLSLLMWIISMGAAMPSLFLSSIIPIPHKDTFSQGCEYKDSVWKTYANFQQNLLFLVAFVVMGFCYIRILRKITRARSHRRNRAVKLVFCIVAVFFIGWVPYNIVIFLKILSDYLVPPFDDCNSSVLLEYTFHVCRLVAFSHCCLNPVFYAFVGVKFRSHLTSMLRKMFSRQSAVEEPQLRMQNLISHGTLF